MTLIIRDAWAKRKIFSIIIVQMTHYFRTDIYIVSSYQCVFLHQFIILKEVWSSTEDQTWGEALLRTRPPRKFNSPRVINRSHHVFFSVNPVDFTDQN